MSKSNDPIYRSSFPELTNEKLEELLIEKRQISKDKFLLSQLSFGLASLFSITTYIIASVDESLPTNILLIVGIVSLIVSFISIRSIIFLIFISERIKENKTQITRENIRILIKQKNLNSEGLLYISPHKQYHHDHF